MKDRNKVFAEIKQVLTKDGDKLVAQINNGRMITSGTNIEKLKIAVIKTIKLKRLFELGLQILKERVR